MACTSECPAGQKYYVDNSSGTNEYVCNTNCPPVDSSGLVISTFSALTYIRQATGSTAPLSTMECISECPYAFKRGTNSQNNICVPKCNAETNISGNTLLRSKVSATAYECVDVCPSATRRYHFINSDTDDECSATCSPSDSNRITGTESQKFYEDVLNKCVTVCPSNLYENGANLKCKDYCSPTSLYNKRNEDAGELSQDICIQTCPAPTSGLDSKAYFYESDVTISDGNGGSIVIRENICTMTCDQNGQIYIYTDQSQTIKQPRCVASCPTEASLFYLNSNNAKECTSQCQPTTGLFLSSATNSMIFIQNNECKALCDNNQPADSITLICLPNCNSNGNNRYLDY
jgi:hypothetical protein